jgi:hypothetical protein
MLALVCRVSSETVRVNERLDVDNDVKRKKTKDDLKNFCRSFFTKFFKGETLNTKILDKYSVPDAGDLFTVNSLDAFISLLIEKRNKKLEKGADKGQKGHRIFSLEC